MNPVNNQINTVETQIANLEIFANSSNHYLRVEKDNTLSVHEKDTWWALKNFFHWKPENERLKTVEHRIGIFMINNPVVQMSHLGLFQKLPLSSRYTALVKVASVFNTYGLATTLKTTLAEQWPELDELD